MSDICFVLDSSGSEGSRNFGKQLEFVNLVLNEFSFEGTDHTQACVVTYSTRSHTEIRLNSYHSQEALMENVLNIPYRYFRYSPNAAVFIYLFLVLFLRIKLRVIVIRVFYVTLWHVYICFVTYILIIM